LGAGGLNDHSPGTSSVVQGWSGRSGGDQHIPRPEVWRLGARPDWSAERVEPLRRAEAVVGATCPVPVGPLDPPFPGARASSVLVALIDGDQGCEVVLTRRARHLRHHRGEVSFPGGRVDHGETIVEAALREAEEEIGLDRRHVEVLGGLDPVSTWVSASFIVPVVARCARPADWTISPGEVDRVFSVPLVELTRADTYRSEWWGQPPDDHELHFFELDDETVWGATGRILRGLIDRVVDGGH